MRFLGFTNLYSIDTKNLDYFCKEKKNEVFCLKEIIIFCLRSVKRGIDEGKKMFNFFKILWITLYISIYLTKSIILSVSASVSDTLSLSESESITYCVPIYLSIYLSRVLMKIDKLLNNETNQVFQIHISLLLVLTFPLSLSPPPILSLSFSFSLSLSLSLYIYIYIYIYINRPISLASWVFSSSPGDLGSIPGRVIPKT